MPTVSVVIPAYDAAETVAVAASSAADQPGVDVEVIVVDDGSSDDTARVADAVPGVTVLRQRNAGPAAARNRGIRAATSEYVAFLDADDRLLPGWAAAVVELLKAGASIAFTDTVIVDSRTGRAVSRYSDEVALPSPAEQRRQILVENFVPSTACISRKTAQETGGQDENLRGAEDWDLWIRILHAGGTAARDDRALSVYARGHASLSSDRMEMTRQEITLLTKCADLGLTTEAERARQRSLRIRRGRLELLQADAHAGSRTAARGYVKAARALGQPRLLLRAAATAAAPSVAARYGSRSRIT